MTRGRSYDKASNCVPIVGGRDAKSVNGLEKVCIFDLRNAGAQLAVEQLEVDCTAPL